MFTIVPILICASILSAQSLPNTQPLQIEGDLAARMLAGIDDYLERETFNSTKRRPQRPSPERLRRILGVVDPRVPFEDLTLVETLRRPARVHSSRDYEVFAVRWPVLDGLDAEGLFYRPAKPPVARIIALPDADQDPEALVYAHQLASAGCQILIPALVSRAPTQQVNPDIRRFLNQSRREFVYRMAFEMGRHIIGYEIQKTLAAVDWFARQTPAAPVRVIGYGEGGLIALYAAALDARIQTALVSGYFQPREELWREPVYRNVWGVLNAYGDAELAAMMSPRLLLVEPSRAPELGSPGPGAAPGFLTTPSLGAVQAEVERARLFGANIRLAPSPDGRDIPFGDTALSAFHGSPIGPIPLPPPVFQPPPRRPFEQLVAHVQTLVRNSETTRKQFWAQADSTTVDKWIQTTEPYRKHLWEEILGKLPEPTEPLTAQTRPAYDKPKFKGYEVVLPLFPEVFAYGVLLVPKDLTPGEKRPVVVTQHGRAGRPQELIEPSNPRAESVYKHYAAQLADRGFIVYAPQNPYIFEEQYRALQRKANPLKLSLFSFIAAQHERTIEWLAKLPFVDPDRIAFYGLSYGGKTAMRVPPILNRYALAICSGDFGEYIGKMASTERSESFMFTIEHEMYEFDLGNTFNYGDLANLMAPRPFMVERGHQDGVGHDEWVALEFARVRRFFTFLGIPDRAEIEFFRGVHEIRAEGTFRFLHKHLKFRE